MIYSDSRYASGKVMKGFDSRYGVYQVGVHRVFPSKTTSYYTYVWKDGDRIDVLSQRIFGSSDKWYHIMDFNPEIADAMNIPAGTQIRIPNG